MSKLKSPLLSLGAKGTIADSLTFQRRGQTDIVRTKPIPAYRYTLPQAYQRWLYEDYSYLWTQQNEATRRQYAALGSRFHLTGFQYWMKYNLANLPDIALWSKFNEGSGSIAHDSSRNQNHGIIYGASPSSLAINGAFYFDNINDRIEYPYHTALDITEAITIELFINLQSTDAYDTFISKFQDPYPNQYTLGLTVDAKYLRIRFRGTSNPLLEATSHQILPNTLYHIAATYDGSYIRLWRDGINIKSQASTGLMITYPVILQVSGYYHTQRLIHGIMDEPHIYNRALDKIELKRHSERRYPV